MARQKVINNIYYDLTAEEEAELDAMAEAADLEMNPIRNQRNALLSGSDWTRLDDAALAGHTAEEWATYRQALRDLPATYSRQSDVVWPEDPPAAKVTRKTVAGDAAFDAAIASDPDDSAAAQAAYDTAYADTD